MFKKQQKCPVDLNGGYAFVKEMKISEVNDLSKNVEFTYNKSTRWGKVLEFNPKKPNDGWTSESRIDMLNKRSKVGTVIEFSDNCPGFHINKEKYFLVYCENISTRLM